MSEKKSTRETWQARLGSNARLLSNAPLQKQYLAILSTFLKLKVGSIPPICIGVRVKGQFRLPLGFSKAFKDERKLMSMNKLSVQLGQKLAQYEN